MADASIALEQLRGALEAAEADGAAPTRIIPTGPPGNVDISGLLKRQTIEDRRAAGTRTSLRGVYSGLESNDLTLSSVPVDYNNIGFWLSGIAPTGAGTPGTAVAGTAFTRTFTPVEGTTVNTYGTGYYTYNLEYTTLDFASTLTYQMPAMRISNFGLRWDKRASGTDTGVMMEAGLTMGQGTATQGTALTSSLSHVTPVLALGNQLRAYVDSTYGTIGTTNDSQIMSAAFDLQVPVTYHDGMGTAVLNGHTSAHYAQQWVPTFSMVRRFSDKTELTAYLNKTTRAIRIDAIGDALGTAAYTFRFDFVGKPTDYTATQVDGLWYLDLQLEGIYDSTLTTCWQAYLVNDVADPYTTT